MVNWKDFELCSSYFRNHQHPHHMAIGDSSPQTLEVHEKGSQHAGPEGEERERNSSFKCPRSLIACDNGNKEHSH